MARTLTSLETYAFARALAPFVISRFIVQNHATPLFIAAETGQLHVVKWLLGLGARKDVVVTPGGQTILSTACFSGHVDVVRYLVETAKFDPLAAVYGDATVLMPAVQEGRAAVVEWLLRNTGLNATQANTV